MNNIIIIGLLFNVIGIKNNIFSEVSTYNVVKGLIVS